ncbi:MAG: ABC transporter permease [Tenericutes bacterium]|nr:ABC transporter permease [Mycoplasmatota bacterium]
MRNKFLYLIKVSLKRKIDTKWFRIANILIALVIIGTANIDSIINYFGGDFNKPQKIYIIDNTNSSYDIFKQQIDMNESNKEYKLIKYKKTEKELKKDLKNKDIAIVFNNDNEKVLKVKLLSQKYLDILDSQFLKNALYNTKIMLSIEKSNISFEEINSIYEQVDVERVVFDKSKSSSNENLEIIMQTVFPLVILPFFMLVVILVQMIGAEVNDEKTTRGMEIIISNVSPKVHFFSKVIASNIFVIFQGLLLFMYGVAGFISRKFIGGDQIKYGVFDTVKETLKGAINTSFADKLIYMIPLLLILMILTFLAYSLLAGILASMTTTIEDFQQLQTPIMIILFIGYYLAVMAVMFKGSLFITGLSFVPFISAILAPSLFMIDQIGVYHVIGSIVIMIFTNYLLIKYGLRVYKVGILNYSSDKLWSKMWKALK